MRKHTIYPKQRSITEKNKHLPVGSETQQGSARETRQENMRLIKQAQQQMNEKRVKQGYQMEQIRVKKR